MFGGRSVKKENWVEISIGVCRGSSIERSELVHETRCILSLYSRLPSMGENRFWFDFRRSEGL